MVLSLKSIGYSFAAFIAMLGSAIVACVLETFSYVFVRPISRPKHRQICAYFTRAFFLCSTFLLQYWSDITFKPYGDRLDPTGSYLVIINHRSNIDWLLGLAYLAHLGAPYPGNVKSIVKASLGKVPIFGSILRFAEFMFLTRDWATDRKLFLKRLASLRSYNETVGPMWIVLYPEGTRFNEEKRAYSRAYAEAKKVQPYDHVLFPRFKAFTAILSTLRDEFDGIIDATFMFEGDDPNVKGAFTGTSSTTIHAHSKNYRMDEIPEGEEQLEKWLLDRWYEKDKLLSNFFEDPTCLGPSDAEYFQTQGKPSVRPFYALVATFLVSAVAMTYRLSKIKHGLLFLFGSSSAAMLMVVIFVLVSLKPSRKGSGRGKRRR